MFPDPIGFGKHIGFTENLLRQMILQRPQQLQFRFCWQTTGCQIRVGEITRTSSVLSVKQILVAPFKIKSITECFSHFAVLENAFTGVEGKSLHAPWKFVGNFITDDEMLIEGFPGIGGCPQF